MLIKNRFLHNFSFVLSVIFLVSVIYFTVRSYAFVDTHHIDIEGYTYIHQVSEKPYVKQAALQITNRCKSDACKIQKLLNYVSTMPYKINPSIPRSPKNTIKNGYGDCDDKSNLLISMLHSLNYESYFVMVPGHIFTIVRLEDERYDRFKGLYLDGKKYYILETTAKMSHIGFPLKYDLDKIKAVINPFTNEKLQIDSLQWKS